MSNDRYEKIRNAPEDVASARSGNVKVVASFATLMHLAAELGQARLSGDAERIERAQKAHDEYRDICLKADEMLLNTSRGGLL